MKRLFLLSFIFTSIVISLKAQDSKRDKPILLSIGVEGALPVGDFGDLYNFGIGGTVQGEIKPAKELGITLNAGYITYSGKDIGIFKVPSFGLIPVLGGVKYYFSSGAYAHGQLGAGFGTDEGSGTNFMYAPGIGYMFAPGFDAELKYVGISSGGDDSGSANSIGLRVAYNF